MFEQVKFIITNPAMIGEGEEGKTYGGIAWIDCERLDYVICGCCGAIFNAEDVEIVERYTDWMDLTQAIVGE